MWTVTATTMSSPLPPDTACPLSSRPAPGVAQRATCATQRLALLPRLTVAPRYRPPDAECADDSTAARDADCYRIHGAAPPFPKTIEFLGSTRLPETRFASRNRIFRARPDRSAKLWTSRHGHSPRRHGQPVPSHNRRIEALPSSHHLRWTRRRSVRAAIRFLRGERGVDHRHMPEDRRFLGS